ncbi:FAD binding domain-containing protein [Thelonectria olida]|uniref:FAD binding domain-containing protein n=1 Tax=Thelonectria olida TaxID=1576542 RepID=A0A9P8VW86_9HYPO|nr:FAD binding domain-containing protein [Thelonectria olida]
MLSLAFVAAIISSAAVANADGVPSVSLETGAACACEKLSAKYGNEILTSDSTNYTEEATAYWDIRSDLSPKCIFLPKAADEVADAISIVYSCGTQFAIRGGGHMNFPGSNNIDGGVLLALNQLTDIDIAKDNKTFEVGPGARWVDVYSALAPYDLYCIGGRLKTIGVPGLTLIGGFHYLINKYGMVMDNVLSYDVVLGNGTQVVANSTTNRELFWALKGGGSNFGVVTKFTFKALPIPLLSTTIQQFNESNVYGFIKATVGFAEKRRPELAAGSVISITYNLTSNTISPSLLGVQEGTESPPSSFFGFSSIPSVAKVNKVMRPIEWHTPLESPEQMFRIQFAHKTIKPNTKQLYRIYQSWKAAVEEVKDVEGLLPTFVMNVLPATAASIAKRNGIGNAWGLEDDQSYILWQLATSWAKSTDDLRMTNWAQSFVEGWHAENEAKGLASDFIYMGDAGEFQDAFAGLPLKNVRRLRAVREQYDPEAVFSRLNWGGFKLGAV